MSYQPNSYSYLLIGSTILLLSTAIYAFSRFRHRGALELSILGLGSAVWALFYAFELMAVDMPTKLLWGKLQYIGICSVPLAWVLFAARLTGRDKWLNWKRLLLICALPAITLLLALNMERHQLIWSAARLDLSGALPLLVLDHGILFWVYWIYAQILVFIGSILLSWVVIYEPQLYRGQMAYLLAAGLSPWLGNILYVTGLNPIHGLDLTPLAFTISVICCSWVFFRFQTIELSPIARIAVVDELTDGVIVMDTHKRLVDINPAALRILGVEMRGLIGQTAAQVFKDLPDVLVLVCNPDGLHTEISKPGADGSLYYDVQSRPLHNRWGTITGCVVTMRDVTVFKIAIQQLHESEERFRQLVELSPEAIAVHQDGLVVFINQTALTLFRAQAETDVLGRAMLDFVHPDSRSAVLRRIADMAASGQPAPRLEEKFLRLDGSAMDVEVTSTPLQFRGRLAYQAIISDISYRKRLERAIQSIEKGVSSAIGQEFFETAVVHLSQALESDQVFIATYSSTPEMLSTIAVVRDGVIAQNFQYSIKGAPCENVVNQRLLCYPSGVASLFPADKALADMSIEGYLGMPLWDSAHNPTGIIVALYCQPIADPEYGRALIQIFASRVQVEMERSRVLADLRESQALLKAVFDSIPFEVWVSNADGVCILQNYVSRRYWGDTVGKLPKDLHILSAGDQQEWRKKNLLALSGQIIYETNAAEINGTRLLLETTMAPIRDGERITGFIGVNIDVTAHKQAEEKLKNSFDQLSVQREIDQIILGGSDIRSMLDGIARHAAALLRMDAVEILQYDPDTIMLEIMARRGVQAYSTFKSFPVTGDIASRAVLQQQTIFESDFETYLGGHPSCEQLRPEKFRVYISLPLIAKGSVRGVIEFFHRSNFQPDGEWWQLAQTLAGQAAIAIDNMSMFMGLQRSNSEISLAYDLTLEGWSKALEVRDQETEGHSQRVASLTMRLAEALGVPRSQIVNIRRGALLHDIGKMGIPDDILHKPGPLTGDEWMIIKKHPQTAYELLRPIPFLRPALDIPYCHHERWDGSGYPRGLKGEAIPLAARIFSVVDVWDALGSHRPYHRAESPVDVARYLRQQSGILFDPQIVAVFLQLVREE